MKTAKLISMICLALTFYACKDTFEPEVKAQYKNLLVVDGFINVGGETTIKLSRTGDLQDWQSTIPEKNADVVIEGEHGTIVKGVSSGDDGKIILATTSLSLNERYKVKITTANGEKYHTDYLPNKESPEIDSVNFKIENKGFQIYVNTHDDSGKTRYYTWNYQETWEIRSPFQSFFEYKNGMVVKRDPEVNIQYCWSTALSSSIFLGTTERLSEDRITLSPINYVTGNSIKVAHLYSILINQYGLTPEAYQYLENMKKNTEQIGSIFDPQPSEIIGNIICTSDPKQQVIGWLSAGTVSQKRLFISYKDKPAAGYDWVYSQLCESVISPPDSLIYYLNGNKLIIDELTKDGINKYVLGSSDCIDCRLKGANIKPIYWPN